MSKKHKCLDCDACMRFAVPPRDYLDEHTKLIIERRIVCGHTGKERCDDAEVYCGKKFVEADELKKRINSREYQINLINCVIGKQFK